MTELTHTSPDSAENTRTVETFLHALQDADYETAEAALDENLGYQNVGLQNGRRADEPRPPQGDAAVPPDGRPDGVRGEDPPHRGRRRRGSHRAHRCADRRPAAASVLGLRRVRG